MRSVLLPDVGVTPGCGGRLIADIVRSRDNPAVCATGNLLNLTPGTYRITETQKTGFVNTDPGPGVNTAAFPFKDVVVGVGGATTGLGNTCLWTRRSRAAGFHPRESTASPCGTPWPVDPVLNGFKYKDVNNNGDFDAGTDLNGAGFTFQLKSGTTVLQTAVSGSDGTYSFTNHVRDVGPPPGWAHIRCSAVLSPFGVRAEPRDISRVPRGAIRATSRGLVVLPMSHVRLCVHLPVQRAGAPLLSTTEELASGCGGVPWTGHADAGVRRNAGPGSLR
jgi:hypothetical protein